MEVVRGQDLHVHRIRSLDRDRHECPRTGLVAAHDQDLVTRGRRRQGDHRGGRADLVVPGKVRLPGRRHGEGPEQLTVEANAHRGVVDVAGTGHRERRQPDDDVVAGGVGRRREVDADGALAVVHRQRGVGGELGEVVDLRLQVGTTGVLLATRAVQGTEVVTTRSQERVHRHRVRRTQVDRLAVQEHLLDPLTLSLRGVVGVGEALTDAELQERTRRTVGLPLLLESSLDLGTGQVHVDQRVRERLHVGGLLERHRAREALAGSEQVCAQTTGVHERDLRRPEGLVGSRVTLDLGDQVAQGRLTTTVLGGAVGQFGPVERRLDLTQRLRAQHVGLGHGRGDDVLRRTVDRVVRRARAHQRQDGLRLGLHVARDRVDGEDQLVEVGAVLTGGDHRTLGHRTVAPPVDRERAVVGKVRVTRHDRVDVVVDALHDRAEVGAGTQRRDVRTGRRRSTLVDQQDHDVGALGDQVVSSGVGRLDDVGHLDVGDAVRGDQLGQVLGDRTHVADLHATLVLDPGAVQGRVARGLELHVRTEVLPLGATERVVLGVVLGDHPVDQVVVALVELVVADRRDIQAGLVERVDRRLVVGDEGLERRGTDQVTGSSERRVRVLRAQLLDRTGEYSRTCGAGERVVGDPAVEVVRGQDLHVDRVARVGAQVESDDHRVVVGGPVGVRLEQRLGRGLPLEASLAGIRHGVVVVEEWVLVGVDLPAAGTGDLVVQGRGRQGLVEVTELTVEEVAVGLHALEALQEVDVVVVLQGADRALLRVGVQVTDDQEVGVAALRGVGGQVVGKRLRGRRAGAVAVPGAVLGRVVARATPRSLALEVVHRHRDPLARGDLVEGLDQGRPVERVDEEGVLRARERLVLTDRGDGRRLVEEGLLDRVRADETGVDVVVRARCGRGVEGVDDLLGGEPGVVLDLDQTEDVGVDRHQGVDDLGQLTLALLLGVGTTAVVGPGRSARPRAARGGLVDRREVVQHVEAGDLEPTADLVRRRRPRVRGLEGVVLALDRAQLPRSEGVLEDAGEVGDGVPAAEGVAGAQPRGRVVVRLVVLRTRGRRVLAVAVVVQDDPAGRQVGEEGVVAGDTGLVRLGELVGPLAGGQHDLTVAGLVEVLADRERGRDRGAHPLHVLEGRGVQRRGGRRERDHGGGGQRRVRTEQLEGSVAEGCVDLGGGVELGHVAGDAELVARAEVGGAAVAAEDVDALRGRRVGVRVRVLLLEEEPVGDVAGRDHRGDDRLDGHGAVHERGLGPVALDLGDQDHLTGLGDREVEGDRVLRGRGGRVGHGRLDRVAVHDSGRAGDLTLGAQRQAVRQAGGLPGVRRRATRRLQREGGDRRVDDRRLCTGVGRGQRRVARGRVGRGRHADGEVRRVVVGVRTLGVACHRRRVRRSRGRRGLEAGAGALGAVADHVDEAGVPGQVAQSRERVGAVDQQHLPGGAAHRERRRRVGSGQCRLRAVAPVRGLDEVVPTRRDGAGQRDRATARVARAGRSVLDAQLRVGQVDGLAGRVVELHEVGAEGTAAVATSSVHLRDDDPRAGRVGLGCGGTENY